MARPDVLRRACMAQAHIVLAPPIAPAPRGLSMFDEDAILRQKILLSVQRALLGSVTSNLRGVAIDWNNNEIRIVGYYDGPISDDDREEMSCVDAEVATDFIDAASVDFALHRLDMPERIIGLDSEIGPGSHRAWAFLRKE